MNKSEWSVIVALVATAFMISGCFCNDILLTFIAVFILGISVGLTFEDSSGE